MKILSKRRAEQPEPAELATSQTETMRTEAPAPIDTRSAATKMLEQALQDLAAASSAAAEAVARVKAAKDEAAQVTAELEQADVGAPTFSEIVARRTEAAARADVLAAREAQARQAELAARAPVAHAQRAVLEEQLDGYRAKACALDAAMSKGLEDAFRSLLGHLDELHQVLQEATPIENSLRRDRGEGSVMSSRFDTAWSRVRSNEAAMFFAMNASQLITAAIARAKGAA